MPPKIDRTGQVFGKLTVLEQDFEKTKEKGEVYWRCQCECGRIKSIKAGSLSRGSTKSCGICASDHTGKKFGRLTVLYRTKVGNGRKVYWMCQCDCGNIVEKSINDLLSGNTKSCGCLNREVSHNRNFKNITGQKFGKLTPLEYYTQDGITFWKCQCDCGNTIIVRAHNLQTGHTQSCGCISKSIEEQNIENILKENNLPYQKEYIFKDLPKRRFDFYIDNKYLIEFDGEQHTKFMPDWHQTYDKFKQYQQRDKEKNKYCLDHNIPLYRIPYEYRDKLTLELLTDEKFRVKAEEL